MSFTTSLQLIINNIDSHELSSKVIKFASKNYLYNESDFLTLNRSHILQLLTSKLEEQTSSNLSNSPSTLELSSQCGQIYWHPNQFKVFGWISVFYAYVTNQDLQQFNQQSFSFLLALFPLKKPLYLEYNLHCLVKPSRNSKLGWCQQQLDLLASISKQAHMKHKWNSISFALYEISGKKFFRSPHQCREKWFNHLDPIVKHTKWTIEEDYRLLQIVSQNGTKWAHISKCMDGTRTEHMVKNRYHSLIKKFTYKYQRFSPKKIASNVLSDLKKKISSKEISKKQEESNKKDQQFERKQGDELIVTQSFAQQCFELDVECCFQEKSIELIDYCSLDLQQAYPSLLD